MSPPLGPSGPQLSRLCSSRSQVGALHRTQGTDPCARPVGQRPGTARHGAARGARDLPLWSTCPSLGSGRGLGCGHSCALRPPAAQPIQFQGRVPFTLVAAGSPCLPSALAPPQQQTPGTPSSQAPPLPRHPLPRCPFYPGGPLPNCPLCPTAPHCPGAPSSQASPLPQAPLLPRCPLCPPLGPGSPLGPSFAGREPTGPQPAPVHRAGHCGAGRRWLVGREVDSSMRRPAPPHHSGLRVRGQVWSPA